MKLEHQVCSLDLSKKLKELGVRQDSSWMVYIFDENGVKEIVEQEEYAGRSFYIAENYAAAFTVAELGEMLPFKYGGASYLSISKRSNGQWLVQYSNPIKESAPMFAHNELAEAVAKMLIHLIEKGIAKP